MKIPDPTEEIRAIKRKLSDACGNDIHRIAEEARRNYQASQQSRLKTQTVPNDTVEHHTGVATDTTDH